MISDGAQYLSAASDSHLSWYLESCEPSSVSQTLRAVRSRLEMAGRLPSRVLNSNTIALDFVTSEQRELNSVVRHLIHLNPGKIFYFSNDNTLTPPSGEALGDGCSAGGVTVEKGDGRSIFTECVFGYIHSTSPGALASVVRANLHVGFPPTLLIFGKPDNDFLITEFVDSARVIIFSSEWLRGSKKILDQIFHSSHELVDFEWIQLSGWRTQLRNLSLQYGLSSMSRYLNEVEIYAASSQSDRYCGGAILLAGWLLRQLRSEVRAFTKRGVECVSEEGTLWNLKLLPANAFHSSHEIPNSLIDNRELDNRESGNSNPVGLRALRMRFGVGSQLVNETALEIARCKNNRYITTVESGGEQFHSTGKANSNDCLSALSRYFAQGESTSLYREAYGEGLMLDELIGSDEGPGLF